MVDAISFRKPVQCHNISHAIVSDNLFYCSLAAEDLLEDEGTNCAAGLNMESTPFGPSCE